jgi:putative transposase
MKQATSALPAPPSPFADSDWFDPLEEAVRGQVRSFIEQLLEEELEAALGRGRYERAVGSNGRRHGHRPRQLVTTFGPLSLSVPRARLHDAGRASRSGRARSCRPTSGSAIAPRR